MLIENFSELIEEKINGDAVSSFLKINAGHPLFEGHFPEHPITPGVVLIQLFKEQAERCSGAKLRLVKASNIKFLAIIDPGIDEHLRLESQLTYDGENALLIGEAVHQENIALKLRLTFKKITE